LLSFLQLPRPPRGRPFRDRGEIRSLPCDGVLPGGNLFPDGLHLAPQPLGLRDDLAGAISRGLLLGSKAVHLGGPLLLLLDDDSNNSKSNSSHSRTKINSKTTKSHSPATIRHTHAGTHRDSRRQTNSLAPVSSTHQ